MKKLKTLFIALTALISINSFAQNPPKTIARFHQTHSTSAMPWVDNSETLNDVDTIVPNAGQSFYKFTALTHAKTLDIATTTARQWDKTTLLFVSDTLTAGRVITFGSHCKTTTNGATVTAKKSKGVVIVFIFDGVAWREQSRAIEY